MMLTGINGFGDPVFWGTWIVGWLGIALWLLKTLLDATDQRLTPASSLRHYVLTFLVTVVSHFTLCIALHEMSQLNIAASIASGYGGQSIIFGFLGTRLSRVSAAKEKDE